MALQTFNFGAMNTPVSDFSGLSNLFSNYYKGFEQAQTPRKLEAERLRETLMNSILGTQAKYAEPNAQANLQSQQLKNQYYGPLTEAQIQHYKDQASGKTFAPSALGKLIQERNDLAAQNPDDPLLAEYDRVIKSQGSGRSYAPSALGKLSSELQQVEEGYLPGSNGQITLDPEQQQDLRNKYLLQMQKSTSDAQTRTAVLRGSNLLKSIDASNIDALTRYSGPAGASKLAIEKAKDLTGNPSKEYLEHLEALQAVELEAKELRQFFGDSITPTAADALYKMVNATSLTRSPEAAKRMIQKSRDTIKKQVKTFSSALDNPEAYNIGGDNIVSNKVQELSQQLQGGSNNIAEMTDEQLLEAYLNGQ